MALLIDSQSVVAQLPGYPRRARHVLLWPTRHKHHLEDCLPRYPFPVPVERSTPIEVGQGLGTRFVRHIPSKTMMEVDCPNSYSSHSTIAAIEDYCANSFQRCRT
jgi:hypothetical protein